MTRVPKLILTALTLLGAFAAVAAPANAATGYANLCPTLKTAFCTDTLEPGAVAVDNSTGPSAGDIWIRNGSSSSGALVKLDASGNQLLEITNSDIPNSAKPFAHGISHIAVDPTSGAVYAVSGSEEVSREEGVVTKFSSSGVFQYQITAASLPEGLLFDPNGIVVAPNGDLYIESSVTYSGVVPAVYKFSPVGVYIEELAIPAPNDGTYESIAVDAQGDLYIEVTIGYLNREKARTPSHVSVYGPTGVPLVCPNGSNVLYETPERGKYYAYARVPVAVDTVSGHVFIGEDTTGSEGFIAEYGTRCGAPQAVLGLAGEFGGLTATAVGVDDATGEVYATSSSGLGEVAKGLIFGQVTVPDVTTAPSATGVTRKAALVNGTVDPDETSVTTCEFEYGPSTTYGQSVPCSQALPLEGDSPVAVSAELKFSLPPASTVHYRLKAGNVDGNNYGADQTFGSEPLPPPVVGGLPASEVSQFAATFNGTLRTGEAAVSYHFEYGTTSAYGQVAPIPDSYTPITSETVTASQPVNGLLAGTTYHYRLVASSPGATNVAGPDETFTTLPVPPPGVATGGASGVGVSSVTLSGSIDPLGWETSYEFQYGTSTGYGSSWPTVSVELGAFEGAQPVTVSIPNLQPSTTYHYRLVASSGGGTSYGPDMTFTTGEYPAQIIQEPSALRTLLVPATEATKPASSKTKKKTKKTEKKAKKGKKKARKSKGHPRAKHATVRGERPVRRG